MRILKALFLFALLGSVSIVYPCPICLTDTGRQVRTGIFNHDFFLYLFYTTLPFFIFLFIIFLIYHGFFIMSDFLKD
jgi:hypothetical protein